MALIHQQLIFLPHTESYLINRLQICCVDGHFSNRSEINYGIPQGSILGPLLFLIYVNDLPNCVENSNIRMFADDTTLTVSGQSIQEIESKINSDLTNIKEWISKQIKSQS